MKKLVFNTVKKHGKCLLLTEEPFQGSFMEVYQKTSIQENCFEKLDDQYMLWDLRNLPGIPLNSTLETKCYQIQIK